MRELVKDGCVLDVCAAAVFDPTDGLLSTAGRGTEAHAQRVLGHPIVSDIGNLAHALTLLVACPATSFASTRRLVGLLHSAATALLLEFEQSTRDPFASPLLAQFLATNLMAALTLLESILQRFYVDDAYLGVKEHDLVEAWNVVVDTMASLHFITLSFGRDGVDVFKRASTLAIQFILRRPAHIVDQATSRLFAAQPCLTYMASSGRSLKAISRMRSYLVLFYLDLTEHLVPHLSAQSLANLALPLASRYAGHEAIREVGPEWFESAHAVILAVLELVAAEDSAVNDGAKRRKAEAVLEVVPWYTDLLLQLYPNSGISADLLRIAYTAAVRAATTNNAHSNGPTAGACGANDHGPAGSAAEADEGNRRPRGEGGGLGHKECGCRRSPGDRALEGRCC
ncbi:hypothetical protein GQ54DRAFT_341258 [Martensiomyces pterosporus]|nr:hypothetical protein GQ54DRAFT_341258 [Martensiomyces pterosporus]